MKKIVHISSAHGLFDNRIFWKECKSLNEKYDLTLIIPYNKSGVIEGIRVIGLQSETSRVKRMLIATFNAYRHAVKEDATLYHLHDPELIPVGLLLRLRGKQVIFDMHENTPKSIRSKRWVPERIRTLTSSLYSILERITLNRFGVIFAEESYER
ncbi:MAG TPA: glycosyltransferase, partial [Fodinibius sp.]|nr:glycosyltransferase [Fodinibius sp.]